MTRSRAWVSMTRRRLLAALALPLVALLPLPAAADAGRSGFVVMHGKGGSPTKHVADLAAGLEDRGFAVANLEMPWSSRRNYDVDVAAAEREVEAALQTLRDKGATQVFVAGHSQGGLFALHLGGRLTVAGVVAIAPGGDVSNPLFRDKLAEPLAQARQLVADGRGGEPTRLADFESAKGTYPIVTTPAAYLSWFSPDGAMNMTAAVRAVNPALPVLYVAPTRDYPGLQRSKRQMFEALPKHPQTRLYEPDASHIEAPSASAREIGDWATAVAGAR